MSSFGRCAVVIQNDGKVGKAIVVEISGGADVWAGGKGVAHGREQHAVASVGQQADHALSAGGIGTDHGEIRMAIAIEIRRTNPTLIPLKTRTNEAPPRLA